MNRETALLAKTLDNQLSIFFFPSLFRQISEDHNKYQMIEQNESLTLRCLLCPRTLKLPLFLRMDGWGLFFNPSLKDFNLKSQRKEPLTSYPQFADGTEEAVLLGLAGLGFLRFKSLPAH